MAHVYAVDQGLGLQNETVDAVHYDDATALLLIVKVRVCCFHLYAYVYVCIVRLWVCRDCGCCAL